MTDEERSNFLLKEFKGEYTETEKLACRDYISMTWAESINKYYRLGEVNNLNNELHDITEQDIIEKASIIQKASKKTLLPKNMMLYRITVNMPDNLKVGDIYTDKGLGSTSAVSRLLGYNMPEFHKVTIKAKAGMPVVNMSLATKKSGVDYNAEIIMPLNTSYKVNSVSGQNIELEVL